MTCAQAQSDRHTGADWVTEQTQLRLSRELERAESEREERLREARRKELARRKVAAGRFIPNKKRKLDNEQKESEERFLPDTEDRDEDDNISPEVRALMEKCV